VPSENKYLYNGKELQDEQLGGVNLDWLDYHARMYDPALGRWHTQDKLSEWYYDWTPYGYVGNNPIGFTDPTGLFRTKAGARLWRFFNGGEGDILQDKGGEYFVGQQVESNDDSGEATVTYSRVFDRNGRSEGRDLALEAAVEAFDTQHNWAMALNSMGVEYSYTSNISDARQSTTSIAATTVLPNPIKAGTGMVNSSKAVEEGANAVYHSVQNGVTQYVGITNNLARRAAQHLATKGINIEPLMKGLSRADARAVEQALIEVHGLSKNGGTLLNKINSIAQTNPTYAAQVKRGYKLLRKTGYQ